ncbi:nuclear autoantigenic sperm protein-like isoform X4 [Rhinatrema bivittatum]|uniref:nuclear autoantigenic sperm protein-like isoform X4 n=1 Tax=Rhinatrema bivittatum TaxID=194408 RepID=UPI00112B2F7B|nr:nuclear autoantigenic sperm protein-like isoform X4 [Rhinatrema bivittatum]
MAEESQTDPCTSERMEDEAAAPSTSTDQTDSVDVDGEAKKLLGLGNRHLVMGDIPAAINAFQEASSLLGKKYGETADECGEAFFLYGKSLLELARMENSVLGNALEGVPEDENGESDSRLQNTEDLNDESEEDKDYEATEDKENDEVGNLQLAWEMLELAKVIYGRKKDKEAQLRAAEAHLKLGEVSMETENFSQAIEDFQACLTLQKQHLEAHDRLLAETHYQLGLAYHYSNQNQEAVLQFTESMGVIEKRMAVLMEQIVKSEGDSAAEHKKEMEELKELLPEIKEKIEDAKDAQKSGKVSELALKETLIPMKRADGAASSNGASDISHLVRKKRKPEDESPRKDNEAKKLKQESVVNGGGGGDAAAPSGNDGAEKMEEAKEQTQTEPGAVVESTA